jgi:2-polyprenyl-6-methoxyphenol hydroxylase-like FAD-dependent oxidoreductase
MNRTFVDSRYDAIIVGARVAGASTAMLLSRAGLRVLVLDKSAPGSDTSSTHALMRGGVLQLHRWGILDRVIATHATAIRRTTFHYGDEAIPIDIKERDGVDALYAPRRTALDPVLAEAAREAGARVVYGATVESLVRAHGRVTGVRFRDARGVTHRVTAPLVIGADGMRSLVAREVSAPVTREGAHYTAVIYGYFAGLELDGTHWHFGRNVAAGGIPTNDGLACVFASMTPDRYETLRDAGVEMLFERVIAENSGDLAARVAAASRVGKLHPLPGRSGFIRRPWGPGWALVGDAGCFKDPLTAHGMTDALRDAEYLARAVVSGTDEALDVYQSERDAFAVEFLDLSDVIASFDWDYERVKELHRRLSKLMNRECDRLLALDSVPV